MTARLDAFSDRLGYRFNNPERLRKALTHASSTQERLDSNERLEFLGDRVLGLVLAELLLNSFPEESEGEIAYRFTALAQRDALASVAETVGIAEALRLSSGERSSGGAANPGVLADAMEAVLAAIYLDGGLEPARAFVHRHWTALMQENRRPPKDAKTTLQEWAQGHGLALPSYRVLGQEGPDHQPLFTSEVSIDGHPPARGQGNNKRAAEQAAAEAMLQAIKDKKS